VASVAKTETIKILSHCQNVVTYYSTLTVYCTKVYCTNSNFLPQELTMTPA